MVAKIIKQAQASNAEKPVDGVNEVNAVDKPEKDLFNAENE